MKPLVVLVLIMSFFTSCSNKITAPLTSVMNTEPLHHKWQVIEMRGVDENLPYTYLDLRDIARTQGSAGCSQVIFTPTYSYNNRVELKHVSVPLSMCEGNTLMDQQFLKNLKEVYYYAAGSNQLSLLDKHRKKLFEAIYDADDEQASLLRKWEIVKMMNADNEKLLKAKSFLDFTNLNRATAYVGCNELSFQVTHNAQHNVAIANTAQTKMHCRGNVNEEVFLKLLPLVKIHQVIGNRLKLFDKDNALLIEAVTTPQ